MADCYNVCMYMQQTECMEVNVIYYSGGDIKVDKMDRSCATYGEKRMHRGLWW